jgi:hypothetical protein
VAIEGEPRFMPVEHKEEADISSYRGCLKSLGHDEMAASGTEAEYQSSGSERWWSRAHIDSCFMLTWSDPPLSIIYPDPAEYTLPNTDAWKKSYKVKAPAPATPLIVSILVPA